MKLTYFYRDLLVDLFAINQQFSDSILTQRYTCSWNLKYYLLNEVDSCFVDLFCHWNAALKNLVVYFISSLKYQLRNVILNVKVVVSHRYLSRRQMQNQYQKRSQSFTFIFMALITCTYKFSHNFVEKRSSYCDACMSAVAISYKFFDSMVLA